MEKEQVMNKEMKLAIYIRVAKKETTNKNSGVRKQKEAINSFLKGKKKIIFKEYYIDNGFSGRNYSRPEFKRLMEDIKHKKINTIIVNDISRFGRKINVLEKINKLKEKYGVDFISVNEEMNTPDKKIDFEFQRAFNQFYKEDRLRRLEAEKAYREMQKHNKEIIYMGEEK